MAKQDYNLPRPKGQTRKGTKPNNPKKPAVPGTGRNKPAKGYNPVTKEWHQVKIHETKLERNKDN
jgi:hypothetical protein